MMKDPRCQNVICHKSLKMRVIASLVLFYLYFEYLMRIQTHFEGPIISSVTFSSSPINLNAKINSQYQNKFNDSILHLNSFLHSPFAVLVGNRCTEELVLRKDLGKILFTIVINLLLELLYPIRLIVISSHEFVTGWDSYLEYLLRSLRVCIFVGFNNDFQHLQQFQHFLCTAQFQSVIWISYGCVSFVQTCKVILNVNYCNLYHAYCPPFIHLDSFAGSTDHMSYCYLAKYVIMN